MHLYGPYNAQHLYKKYQDELLSLSNKLRDVYLRMRRQGFRATFGDVEGEMLYMLIREARPNIVYEISPDCGWSTNYILAALTANQHGVVHSFELMPKKHGKPTFEVIKANQHTDWDWDRYIFHLGDVLKTSPEVLGTIDFLLLDSCHDDWFAEWYVNEIFPRVNGLALIQDISFVDMLEPSTEASWLWAWCERNNIALNLVGYAEQDPEIQQLRSDLAERRALRSNSIVMALPTEKNATLPEIPPSPRQIINEAVANLSTDRPQSIAALDQLSNRMRTDTLRSTSYRTLAWLADAYQQADLTDESIRVGERAIARAVERLGPAAAVALSELVLRFLRASKFRLAYRAWASLASARLDWPLYLIRAIRTFS